MSSPPPPPRPSREHSRRIALALAVVALVLAAAGALSFRQFVDRTSSDPGFPYRDRATLEKVLKQAGAAEAHGAREAALVNYRFIVAVGAHGDSTLEPYVAAARAGVARLTPAASDTPPGRPR